MKIYYKFKANEKECGFRTSATLGTFDGVHIGHREILKKLVDCAKNTGTDSAVLTFDRHPISVINPDFTPMLLTTLDEKIEIFKSLGIDRVFVLHFTKETANMNPEQFIRKYMISCLGMRIFFVGYDHGFGKDRSASSDVLKELSLKLDYKLEIIPPVKKDDIIVKSSIIRNYINEGYIDKAAEFLGREYTITGEVIHGWGIGKKIGFPTANIIPDDKEKLIPKSGVYAGWAEIENRSYKALITIGSRLTFDIKEEAIEVHIPDYSLELYGKKIKAGFVKRIRNIEKFSNTEELVRQIEIDIENLMKFT